MATESTVMAVIRAARPSFRNVHDRVMFAVHSCFLADGYSLTATGRPALADNPTIGEDEVGIDGWNEHEYAYGFVYMKIEKGLKKNVLVKCLCIENALIVDVLNIEENQKEPLHMEINVKEFATDASNASKKFAELYKNFKDLVEYVNGGILAKLEPKLNSGRLAGGGNVNDPSVGVPVVNQPFHPRISFHPAQSAPDSDLFPSSAAGIYPARGPGFGSTSGGMFVGPNDPLFFGSGERDIFGRIGDIPPGARFDPIGPPNVPGFEPGRFIRPPPRRGPGGNHPDLQHFPGSDFI